MIAQGGKLLEEPTGEKSGRMQDGGGRINLEMMSSIVG